MFTTILLSFPFLSFSFFLCHHYFSLRKFSDLPWAKLCLVFKEAGPSEKGLMRPQVSTGPGTGVCSAGESGPVKHEDERGRG